MSTHKKEGPHGSAKGVPKPESSETASLQSDSCDEQSKSIAPGRLHRLNAWLKEHKAIIDTLGITTGLLLLVVTAWYAHLTQAALKLSETQYVQQQTPVWDFAVDNKAETIQVRSATQGIRLEQGDVTYPQAVKEFMDINWPIDPPNHLWAVMMLRAYLKQRFEESVPYDEKYVVVGDRYGFPVCIEFSYTHFGESRRVKGLFSVEFMAARTRRWNTDIELKDVHFLYYVPADSNVQSELGKLWKEWGLEQPAVKR
jgi:hypothetical protein